MIKENDLPDGWKVVELLEHLNLVKSGVKDFTGFKKYVATGSLKTGKIINHVEVEYETKPSRANMEVKENDIIFAKMKDTMKIFRVSSNETKYIFSTGFSILRVMDYEMIHPDYVFYWLKSSYFQNQKNKECTGATQKAINESKLKKFKIPLPPLQTQMKIVAILKKAERLKEWRKESDELTDVFLKSTFLEMFGDLDKKNKGWEMSNLNDVCDELYRYPTFYGFDYLEKGVPIVRIMNILLNGSLDPNISNYVFFDPLLNKKFPRTILEFNDIVMAVRGDGSTAKRIGLVDNMNITGANISPNLIRFKANKKLIHPLYLFKFMTSDVGQTLLQKSVTRTAKKNITAGNIKKIPIPLPPLELQNKFASIVQQVEELREHQSQSKQHIEDLFNVLMQKAFKGELA